MSKPHSPSSFPAVPAAAQRGGAHEWQNTREMTLIQTQMMRSKEEYLANEAADIGRRINDSEHEIFVVCDPAEAMVQQFNHLDPDFIALHDIGAEAAGRLIAGLAAATRSRVQKLVIRRQGYGVALATLEFAELPSPNGPALRVYSTHADADTQQRHLLARALLAHSRLGVVLLGDLPPHAMAAAIEPLAHGLSNGVWPNRHLLVVPLGSAGTAHAVVAPLSAHAGLGVRTTPHAASPAQAWSFISAAWNRLRAGMPPDVGAPAAPAPAAPEPVAPPPHAPPSRHADFAASQLGREYTPMPTPTAHAPLDAPAPESAWQRYARECAQLKGVVSCCVFEVASQRALAHAGARPGPASLGAQGGSLLAAAGQAARTLGLGLGQPEMVVTLAGHVLVLHTIHGAPGIALHVVLDRAAANVAQLRVTMQRLDAELSIRER